MKKFSTYANVVTIIIIMAGCFSNNNSQDIISKKKQYLDESRSFFDYSKSLFPTDSLNISEYYNSELHKGLSSLSINSINNNQTNGKKLLGEFTMQYWAKNCWSITERRLHLYDQENRIKETRIHYLYIDEPYAQFKENFSYNAENNLVTDLVQRLVDGIWVNLNKIIATYNENGDISKFDWYTWELENWRPLYTKSYKYDSNYNLIEIMSGNEVVRYTYEDNNLIEIIWQNYNESDSVIVQREVMFYDNYGNNIEYILQQTDSTGFHNTERKINVFDEFNNNITSIKQIWQDSVWVNEFQNDYKYNEMNLLVEKINYYWNESIWNFKVKDSLSYNNSGLLASELYKYISGYNEEFLYLYDNDKNILSITKKRTDSFDWVNVWKKQYIFIPEFGSDGNVNNYWLANNYPNPFNNSTVIRFLIPVEEIVALKIFNVLGQEVQVLINNDLKSEGVQEILWDASKFSSGVYFYQLIAGDFIETKKMLLIK